MKILVVDDHPFVHELMRAILARAVEPDAVYAAKSFEEAIELTSVSIDLVVLDLVLPGYDGLGALTAFRNLFPGNRVVVLSAIQDGWTIREALRLGACGYITKTSPIDEMVTAFRLIGAGSTYVPRGAFNDESDRPMQKANVADNLRLTCRQRDVLYQIMCGLKNREIARNLDISEHTVKQHARAIFQVLGVSSRTEAVLAGLRIGIKSA